MPRLKPPPPGFERVYVERGWRGCEAVFGMRPTVMVRWLNYLGRERLDKARQEWLRVHGSPHRAGSQG